MKEIIMPELKLDEKYKYCIPALHRLQEAFLIYEDQNNGEWDRCWYKFSEMFSAVSLTKYSWVEALKILLRRFATRHVQFDLDMVRSFYKLKKSEGYVEFYRDTGDDISNLIERL